MKRLIYIAIAVFALGMVSCSKQDVQPNASVDSEVPVWKSNTEDNDDPGLGNSGSGSSAGGGSIVDPTGEDPGGDVIGE